MTECEILQPGLFSTVQDMGRKGFMEYGVPQSGPMDSSSARLANVLLRNPADAAVMEITQMGPKIAFLGPTKIAVCGASLSPRINDTAIENNKVYRLHEGDVLSFGKSQKGCRAYLAIKDGFQTEKKLGSRSWFEGITPHARLEKGMRLAYHSFEAEEFEQHASVRPDISIFSEEISAFEGPEYSQLSSEEKERLQKGHFSVGMDNNRMGIQLQEKLENSLQPILTGPVLPGSVQLTPSGKLMVLMRDGQTTGGYPRVLQLSETGINTLAQKLPGEQFWFNIEKK